ncbi:MAG: polysaccharide deacetylase family protein [Candidatus Omnitrophota bacterium]
MKKILIFLGIIFIIFGTFLFYLNQNYQVPILMYHSFNEARTESYAAVAPRNFYKQMEFIKQNRYEVIGLEQYCELLKSNKHISKNLVVITIDDGYKDNLAAINILKEFDYPAQIFIIADRVSLEGYLSQEDIESFLNNTRIRIGSHTLSHFYLPDVKDYRFKKEIFKSKDILEERFSRDINSFAYPVGGFSQEILETVKEAGYLCACTTNRGFSKGLDRFALRRIKVTDKDIGFKFWAKLSGFYNVFRNPKKPY